MSKNKHLTLEERYKIKTLLEVRFKFSEIGKELQKDPTTISKEIRFHLIFKKTVSPGRRFNACISRRKCHKNYLCQDCRFPKPPSSCSLCKFCNENCAGFQEEKCYRLEKAPYVCNGCLDYQKCTLEKRLYDPKEANSDQGSQFTSDEYKSLLKELGIRQSMDGKSRWADNIMIERWFRSLKTELIYINEFRSPRELRIGITEYVDTYNNNRPHEALDYSVPSKMYASCF